MSENPIQGLSHDILFVSLLDLLQKAYGKRETHIRGVLEYLVRRGFTLPSYRPEPFAAPVQITIDDAIAFLRKLND